MSVGLEERRSQLERLNWTSLDLPSWFGSTAGLRATQPGSPSEPVRWAVPGVWGEEPSPEVVVRSVGELVAEADRLLALIAQVDPASFAAGAGVG